MLTAQERDALVFEHMEYAEKETLEFLRAVRRALTAEKLMGSAYTGLVLAAKTYDPESGETFKAHAWSWVADYLARQFRLEWQAQAKATGKQMFLFDNAVTLKHNAMIAHRGVVDVDDTYVGGKDKQRSAMEPTYSPSLLEAVKQTL